MTEPTVIPNGEFDVESNPVLHTPFEVPCRHWQLDPEEGKATNVLVAGRRPSSDHREYVTPLTEKVKVARRKRQFKENAGELALKKGRDSKEYEAKQAATAHDRINRLREIRQDWAAQGYPGASNATIDLLHHWADQADSAGTGPDAIAPYFAQREAVETIIWLREAGPEHDPQAHSELTRDLRLINDEVNDGIERLAMRMATGTGKTRTMQMLICWAAANAPSQQPARILAITPGLTVKDRLQELIPQGNSTYEALSPKHLLRKIRRARVVVTNYHRLKARDTALQAWAKDQDLGRARTLVGKSSPEWETDAEVMVRICGRDFTPENVTQEPWFVINDEAHHCYQPEKAAAHENVEEKKTAALWFSGLQRMQGLGMLKCVLDLSATPMWIQQAHDRKQADMFRWVVTNYPLPEAIEAGLVKVPRLPTVDDTGAEYAKFRNLHECTEPKGWAKPKKGARKTKRNTEPPDPLKAAIVQAYADYELERERLQGIWRTDPVAIMVAPDIDTANALYEFVAGKRVKPSDPNSKWTHSGFPLWSNVDRETEEPEENPPTLLVHSKLGEADAENTKGAKNVAAAAEIHLPPELKAKRGAVKDKLKHIRNIFNTVGREGEVGSHIRLVISIDMLSEGWDAKNVTHIIGYRKFGTQLLCEQVVGRGLRRSATAVPDPETGRYPAETVNVYGVPFDFLTKIQDKPVNPPDLMEIKPDPERSQYRIEVPAIQGYRIMPPEERLELDTSKVQAYSTYDLERLAPGVTLMAGTHAQKQLIAAAEKSRKMQLLLIARDVVERWFVANQINEATDIVHVQRIRQALTAVEDWLDHPKVEILDEQDLSEAPVQAEIARAVAECCIRGRVEECVVAIPAAGETRDEVTRSTERIHTKVAKRRIKDARKSEIPRTVCDSNLEIDIAAALDNHPAVAAWVRNVGLGLTIPYDDPRTGREREYVPDFVARLEDINGQQVHLIVEGKGQQDEHSRAKARTAERYWCAGVENSDVIAGDGLWRFTEITMDEDVVDQLDLAVRTIAASINESKGLTRRHTEVS